MMITDQDKRIIDEMLAGVGTRLSDLQKLNRWTQEKLAEEADTSQQTITKIVNGRGLKSDTILKLCFSLGISPTFLLTGRMDKVDEEYIDSELSKLHPNDAMLLQAIIRTFLITVKRTNESGATPPND